MTFLVKGAHFRGGEVRELSDSLEAGTKLHLEPEPENEFDAYAIRVLYEGVHIGYVQTEAAPYLHGEVPAQATLVRHVDGPNSVKWPECKLEEPPCNSTATA